MVVSDKSLFEQIENIIKNEGQSTFWRKKSVIIRIVLLITCTTLIFLIVYITTFSKNDDNNSNVYKNKNNIQSNILYGEKFVELSGSINKPGVYAIKPDTRLFMLIEKAGGFSADADREFIARNYNLSVLLSDQQKIYFPSTYDVQSELILENKKVVTTEIDMLADTNTVSYQENFSNKDSNSELISINNDDLTKIISLPGIGEVTAQRIIASRPYKTIEDVVERGIIKQSLFEKIKTKIAP